MLGFLVAYGSQFFLVWSLARNVCTYGLESFIKHSSQIRLNLGQMLYLFQSGWIGPCHFSDDLSACDLRERRKKSVSPIIASKNTEYSLKHQHVNNLQVTNYCFLEENKETLLLQSLQDQPAELFGAVKCLINLLCSFGCRNKLLLPQGMCMCVPNSTEFLVENLGQDHITF